MTLHRLSLVLALAGCGGPGYVAYQPVPGAPDRQTRKGVYYDIEVEGRTFGDAKLSALGAEQEDDDAPAQIRLDLRLRSTTEAALSFDAARAELEVQVAGRGTVLVLSRPRVEGEVDVPRQETRRVGLVYRLPSGVEPEEVTGFELAWVVRTPAGVWAQATPFRLAQTARRVTYVYGPWWIGAPHPWGAPYHCAHHGWVAVPHRHYVVRLRGHDHR